MSVDHALDAEPGDVLEGLRNRQGAGPLRRAGGDGPGDRVLRGVLQGSGEAQEFALVDARGGEDAVEGHPAGGDGAGLVQDDGVHAAGGFQYLGALDQDAELRAPPGADHERGRGGQAQGARAGDDQDGHGGGEGGGGVVGDQQPGDPGAEGEHQDDGYEDPGDLVGEALHLGLAVLRVLHHLRHPGELGVGADPGGLDDQASGGVDGGSGDGVAHGHVDRDGLAGQHGGVHGGAALDDGAVGGDLLAGAHDEPVADRERAHRDPDLLARAQDDDVLGAQLQQGFEGRARLPLGAGLQVAAQEDEGDDPGRDLQVDGGGAVGAGNTEVEAVPHAGHAGVAEEQGPQRPGEGGQRADRDEGVHGGGAVPGVGPGGLVEGVPAPDDDGGREGQGEPLPVVELEGRDHGEQDDGQGERDGDQQALPQCGERRVGGLGRLGRLAPSFLGGFRGGRRRGFLGGVAGLDDGRDQIGDLHVAGVGDAGLLGGVVHRGFDAVHPIELLLDAGGAGGAGHPADREFDRRYRSVVHCAAAHVPAPEGWPGRTGPV